MPRGGTGLVDDDVTMPQIVLVLDGTSSARRVTWHKDVIRGKKARRKRNQEDVIETERERIREKKTKNGEINRKTA